MMILLDNDKKVSIVTENRPLDLELTTPAEAKAWFEGLSVLKEVYL